MINQTKKNSALQLHLKTGEVVFCNFDSGFKPPEMVKNRPVVVISKTSTHWRGLCTVVPFSTTTPAPKELWHVLVDNPLAKMMPYGSLFAQETQMWAKCDMIYTVAFDRLTRPHSRIDGRRQYRAIGLAKEDLAAVFDGIRAYLPSKQ